MSKAFPSFVSVIIPVYNDPGRLKTCLQALEKQTYPQHAYEVIVVDNGSDGSVESVVTEFNQAKASYEEHSGSYAARNKGISLARGEILGFTDSDCIPAPDWIERGVAKLQSVPKCGIVGGEIEMFFQDPDHPTPVELYDSMTYLKQKGYIEKGQFSATANLFTFKQIFDHVGYFDSDLKSGSDKKWGRQVTSFGYKLVYADDVRVAHPARYSLAELLAKERRVAKGTVIVDENWKRNVPPLRWNYESIMEHLPPLPPVIKVMRIKNASLKAKISVIGIWCIIRFLRIKEKWRVKLRRVFAKIPFNISVIP